MSKSKALLMGIRLRCPSTFGSECLRRQCQLGAHRRSRECQHFGCPQSKYKYQQYFQQHQRQHCNLHFFAIRYGQYLHGQLLGEASSQWLFQIGRPKRLCLSRFQKAHAADSAYGQCRQRQVDPLFNYPHRPSSPKRRCGDHLGCHPRRA